MSRKKNYWEFVLKRFSRVLVPYWIYAVPCILLTLLLSCYLHEINSQVAVSVIRTWLIPWSGWITTLPYITYALWFIPVYLVIMMLFPLLMKCYWSKFRYSCILLWLLLYTASTFVGRLRVQEIVFYTLWTYIGLFYGDIRKLAAVKEKRKYLYIISACSLVCMVVLWVCGQPLDMQENKFPPNWMFLFYSCMVMPLLFILVPLILSIWNKLINNKLLSWIFIQYEKRSMTIFLYQSFVFMVVIKLGKHLIPGNGFFVDLLKVIIYVVCAVPTCAVVACVLGWIEDLGIKSCKKKNADVCAQGEL